jgi:RNA polymerase sigma factor (sigma-70 family)
MSTALRTGDIGVAMHHGDRAAETPGDDSDEHLLRRFLEAHDDLAFAKLVTRHAPLVMGVCRRVLGSEQDAEDAFQAAFLVLARKAATLERSASLSAWLYQTAFRLALRARDRRVRRREEPLEAEPMISPESISRIAAEHGRGVLDEELNRLPEKYRLPLFLCCLEGKSREEAAEQLGWSTGSLKGRLERGRQLLRRRLMLRGVSLSVVLAFICSTARSAQAASVVDPSLIAATVQAGMQLAAGQPAAGYVTQHALSLANGSSSIMSLSIVKTLACGLAAMGLLTAGGWMLPAPARGGSARQASGATTLIMQSAAESSNAEFIALLAEGDQPREGDRPRDGEQPREGDRPRVGDRPREGDRPRDGDNPNRRSAEGERGVQRSAEGEGRVGVREGDQRQGNPLAGFRPQTQREAALFQMIQQLQNDVVQLRRELAATRGEKVGDGVREGGVLDGESRNPAGRRDGESSTKEGPRDGQQADLAPGWEKTQNGRVFQAYDQNGDSTVTLDEWLAMRRVAATDTARRELETGRFNEAEPSGDGKFTPAEFIYWYSKGRFENLRDGR